MPRSQTGALVCIVATSAACGETCPGYPIDVSRFSGPSIEGTDIECEGEGVASWPACYQSTSSFTARGGEHAECGDVGIVLGEYVSISDNVVIWLTGEDDVNTALVLPFDACDDPPCPDPYAERVLDGHVAVQQYSPGGRNRGRFEIVFEGGTIRGTYDAMPMY
jgi:hypothetical protein